MITPKDKIIIDSITGEDNTFKNCIFSYFRINCVNIFSITDNKRFFSIFAQENTSNASVNVTPNYQIQNTTTTTLSNIKTTNVTDTFTLNNPISSIVYVNNNKSVSNIANIIV